MDILRTLRYFIWLSSSRLASAVVRDSSSAATVLHAFHLEDAERLQPHTPSGERRSRRLSRVLYLFGGETTSFRSSTRRVENDHALLASARRPCALIQLALKVKPHRLLHWRYSPETLLIAYMENLRVGNVNSWSCRYIKLAQCTYSAFV